MTDRSIHLDIAQTPGENATRLASQPAQSLAETMVNHVLNEFIAGHSTTSFAEGREDTPVPYQGWYWRSVNFFGRITIADTGIGMHEEDIPHLFQPFYQIDSGLTRKHEGTGLGLSICKKIVELMGGSIEVASQWGQGSTFTVRLPRQSGGKA